MFEGRTQELLDHSKAGVMATPEHPDDTERLARLLVTQGFDASLDDNVVRIPGETELTPVINRMAFENDITLRDLRAEVEDLEDVFLRMTQEVAA